MTAFSLPQSAAARARFHAWIFAVLNCRLCDPSLPLSCTLSLSPFHIPLWRGGVKRDPPSVGHARLVSRLVSCVVPCAIFGDSLDPEMHNWLHSLVRRGTCKIHGCVTTSLYLAQLCQFNRIFCKGKAPYMKKAWIS